MPAVVADVGEATNTTFTHGIAGELKVPTERQRPSTVYAEQLGEACGMWQSRCI